MDAIKAGRERAPRGAGPDVQLEGNAGHLASAIGALYDLHELLPRQIERNPASASVLLGAVEHRTHVDIHCEPVGKADSSRIKPMKNPPVERNRHVSVISKKVPFVAPNEVVAAILEVHGLR